MVTSPQLNFGNLGLAIKSFGLEYMAAVDYFVLNSYWWATSSLKSRGIYELLKYFIELSLCAKTHIGPPDYAHEYILEIIFPKDRGPSDLLLSLNDI